MNQLQSKQEINYRHGFFALQAIGFLMRRSGDCDSVWLRSETPDSSLS